MDLLCCQDVLVSGKAVVSCCFLFPRPTLGAVCCTAAFLQVPAALGKGATLPSAVQQSSAPLDSQRCSNMWASVHKEHKGYFSEKPTFLGKMLPRKLVSLRLECLFLGKGLEFLGT